MFIKGFKKEADNLKPGEMCLGVVPLHYYCKKCGKLSSLIVELKIGILQGLRVTRMKTRINPLYVKSATMISDELASRVLR